MFSPNYRKAEPINSARVFRVSESFDLPNILNPGAETGNLAYFDDQVWFKSVNGWTSITGGTPAPSSGNIVVIGNIITANGNLTLNPSGTSTDFSGKNISNVTTINVQTINSTTTNTANISSQNISTGNLSTNTISTNSGNLIINPSGSTVNFSGKNISNVETLTVQTLNSGNIFNTGIIRTNTLSSASGNLVLSPVGPSVDFAGKTIINAIIPGLSGGGGGGGGGTPSGLFATNENIPITISGSGNVFATVGNNFNHFRVTNGSLSNHTVTVGPPNAQGDGLVSKLINGFYDGPNITRFNTNKSWWLEMVDQRDDRNVWSLYSGTGIIPLLGAQHMYIEPEISNAVQFSSGIWVQDGISTISGNLIVNPRGTSTNFSNKNISNVSEAQIQTITSSGNLSVNPIGPSVDFNGKSIINAVISNSVAPQTIMSAGISNTIGVNTTLEQELYTSGILAGTDFIPNSYYNAVGRGTVYSGIIEIGLVAPVDFTLRIINNSDDAYIRTVTRSQTSDILFYRFVITRITSSLQGGLTTQVTFSLEPIRGFTSIPFQFPATITVTTPLEAGTQSNRLFGRFSAANTGNYCRISNATIIPF